MAERMAATFSARVGLGRCADIKLIAASLRTPVGSPVRASFTMMPLAGFFDRRVMPATFNATEFAQPV
jgi:hypothetical protein